MCQCRGKIEPKGEATILLACDMPYLSAALPADHRELDALHGHQT